MAAGRSSAARRGQQGCGPRPQAGRIPRGLRRYGVGIGVDVWCLVSLSVRGPLQPLVFSPHAACPTRKRGARGRRRGGQLRSAKFLFTPLATPPSAQAVVRRGRWSCADRRMHSTAKRAGGAGKAGKGVADGANMNLAERSRPPPCRLCLDGLETQQGTVALAKGNTGPTAVVGRSAFRGRGPEAAGVTPAHTVRASAGRRPHCVADLGTAHHAAPFQGSIR